jgi:hypothetical protein
MTKGSKMQVMLLVGGIATIIVGEWLRNRNSSSNASCDTGDAISCVTDDEEEETDDEEDANAEDDEE